MNTVWLWAWIGCGIIGWIVVLRNPDRLYFDTPIGITSSAILMAFGAPIWGGPVFLAVVLLAPSKQFCPHCQRVIPKTDTSCPHCHRIIEVLPHEAATIAQENARKAEEFTLLARKYNKWYWFGAGMCFVVVPLMVAGWSFVLVRLSDWRFSLIDKPVYQLVPQPEAWLLPAFFIGLVTSLLPLDGLFRLLLRENYREYQEYERRKWVVDPTPGYRLFFGVMTGLTMLLVVLMLDAYVLFYPDAIAISPLWNFGETRYAYTEVQSIHSSMQLDTATWDHPLYVIEFKNGQRWSTRWEDRDAKQLADIMAYISQKSGVPIEQLPVLYDSDL